MSKQLITQLGTNVNNTTGCKTEVFAVGGSIRPSNNGNNQIIRISGVAFRFACPQEAKQTLLCMNLNVTVVNTQWGPTCAIQPEDVLIKGCKNNNLIPQAIKVLIKENFWKHLKKLR